MQKIYEHLSKEGYMRGFGEKRREGRGDNILTILKIKEIIKKNIRDNLLSVPNISHHILFSQSSSEISCFKTRNVSAPLD